VKDSRKESKDMTKFQIGDKVKEETQRPLRREKVKHSQQNGCGEYAQKRFLLLLIHRRMLRS
jgi:hypothetical protein